MATPQEIQQWLAANPGASDQTISQAMQQYGVTPQQMAGATGMDPTQVQSRYSAALPGVDEARTWLNGQLGGGYDSQGFFKPGSVFGANGVYDTSNSQRNNQVLGKAQQMGYSNDQISQILGIPADQIAQYQQANQPLINSAASVFQHDASSPAPYMLGSPQSTPPAGGAMGGPTPHNGHQVGGIGGAGGVMGTMGGPAGGVAGYGAGTGNTGNFGNFSQNPYLSSMADEIGRRTQLGLTDSFNQIRGDAVGTGGLGGSRQGVAQGVATGRAMDSLQGSLAGLFGGQYNADANRGLQQYGMDQNFYNSGRALDQSGAALGANIYNMGVQGGYTPLNQANGIYSQYTGFGTNNGTSSQGGGAMGAVGGALGGAQLYSNLNNYGRSGYGGWGTVY
jgi:hypothetical protein